MPSPLGELKDLPQVEARAGYIIPVKPSGGGMSAAMLAVTIACAIGAGAILTTGGQGGLGLAGWSDAVESVLRTAGWRSPPTIPTEQPASLAEIQRDIGSVAHNIDALATRIDMSARATDQELARLKSELGALKTAQTHPVARDKIADRGTSVAPRTETPEAALAAIRNDLAALKGGLGQTSATRTNDIEALAKRLEKLEVALAASQDVTGAIPTQTVPAATAAPAEPVAVPPSKHPGKRTVSLGVRGWTASEVGDDILISGPRGVYVAEPGAYIPGLGRIDALREGNRLVVISAHRRLLDFDADAVSKRR